MGFGREYPTDYGEHVLHDGAGPEAGAARECGFVAAWRGFAGHVEGALSRTGRKMRCPSATSPTACMCRRGWRRRCAASTTAIWAWAGSSTAAQRKTWEAIESVDDGELWETHLSLKAQLIDFVRRRAREQAERRGEPAETLQQLGKVLSPDALTIGFARRFATYKRANLVLADIRAAGLDGQRSQAAGAVSLCRQGASARRAGQEGAAADCGDDARLRSSQTSSSSSRTTTSTWAATWCRAWTCG